MVAKATISSNATELLAALQTDPKTLPSGAVWHEKEPNSYDSFGEEQNKTARRPINSGRMAKKPTLIGFNASVGYNFDLTSENSIVDWESFLFADRRSKGDLTSTTVVSDGYTVASGGGVFKAGNMIVAESVEGALNTNNFGLKVLTDDGVSAKVLAPGLTAESGAKVRVRKCGHQFATGAAAITIVGGLPVLGAGAFDLTSFGLLPGETVYVGGDAAANQFANAANKGWARVLSVTAAGITFDKTDQQFAADSGTGKNIRLFFGTAIKNEKQLNLQKAFYQAFRRRVGISEEGGATVQSEVIIGCLGNEMTMNVEEEDKITLDVSYMGRKYLPFLDDSTVDAGGTIKRVKEAPAINSAKDSRRLRIGVYPKLGDAITGVPVLLFPAFNEFSLMINNNISENKAITYEGAYAHTPGFFDVTVDLTAYFVSIQGVKYIHEDADLTFDFAVYKDNKGIAWDIPLVGASTEGLAVEANEPIMIEAEAEAAEGSKYNAAMDHAIFVVFFPYLPAVAAD